MMNLLKRLKLLNTHIELPKTGRLRRPRFNMYIDHDFGQCTANLLCLLFYSQQKIYTKPPLPYIYIYIESNKHSGQPSQP